MPSALPAGNDYLATMNPHPHVLPNNQVCVAMTAEPAPEFAFDPHPLPHCDSSGKDNTAVAGRRIIIEEFLRPGKEDGNPLPCDLPGVGWRRTHMLTWHLLRSIYAQG